MQPVVERSFTATADDGKEITIQLVRGFHMIPGHMREPGPQWVKDALCTLWTSDGREVYSADESDGMFRVEGDHRVYFSR